MSVLDYVDSDIFTPVYQNKLPVLRSPRVDAICKELFYAIKGKEEIFIYGDYDMDGFSAAEVWDEVLTTLYDVPPVHFNYVQRQHVVDANILVQAKKSKARIVMVLDSGSGQSDHNIMSMLHLGGFTPIVIDHHNWEGDYLEACKHNLIFNSHEERDLLGGCEISGAYASLLVASVLCEKYFQHSLSYNAMVYALASMYSDVVDLATPPGRALYNMVTTIKMPGPALFSLMNEWNYTVCRRMFSFIIGPKINACFRTEEFTPLNLAFNVRDKYEINRVVAQFKEVHAYASKLVELFTPMFKREKIGNILLCHHEANDRTRALHIRNFSGLIANKIAQEEKSMVVVVIKDNRRYQGSFRDFFNRKMLDTFRLFCKADGHDSAFGLEFGNIEEIRRHLEGLASMLEQSSRKDYMVLSSTLIQNPEDIQALSLYNEYMNVRPRVMILHRCSYTRQVRATQYRKFYEVGLPYLVSSTLPLIEGSNILIEPTITKSVELRCVE